MIPLIRLFIRDIRAGVDKSLLIIQLLLPLLFLFVAGLSYTNLIAPFEVAGRTVPYQQFLAAGLIQQTVMTGSLFAGLLLFIDRRLAMFEQILMGPFTKAQYALSKILSSMSIGLGGAAILTVFAVPFVIGISPTALGMALSVSSVILAALFFGSSAIILSSLVKTQEAFNSLINLLFVIITFVSSTFYPVSAAPPGLQGLLLLNPLSHANDVLRLGLYDLSSPFILWEGVALVVESALAFAVAVWAFRRIRV